VRCAVLSLFFFMFMHVHARTLARTHMLLCGLAFFVPVSVAVIQGTMRRINDSVPSMNPFRPRTEFGALEWFKLLVLGPILLPIRLPLFMFFLIVAAILAKVCFHHLPAPLFAYDSLPIVLRV
jgi:hypothetical protein